MIPVLITQNIHLAMKIHSLCQFVISCLLRYCYFPCTRELKLFIYLWSPLYTYWLSNTIILQFSKLLWLKKKVPRIIIHFLYKVYFDQIVCAIYMKRYFPPLLKAYYIKNILITKVQKVMESVKIHSNKQKKWKTQQDLFPQINQAQVFFIWKFHQKLKN